MADDSLTPAQRAERGDWVGCTAGPLARSEYLDGLTAAGFTDPTVNFTHQAADGLQSAIVRATKPATVPEPEPVATGGTAAPCC